MQGDDLDPATVGVTVDPIGPFRATGVCSPAMLRIPHLHRFLPETQALIRLRRRVPGRVDSIAGWGATPGAARVRAMAEQRQLPYLACDEGFVRALGPAVGGGPPSSLVVDPVGIYYDATRPSALEQLLESAELPAAALDAAQAALALLLTQRLTRANTAPDLEPDELDFAGKPLVLVIDQAVGDPSVELGLAGARQFDDMLDAALDEHPAASVMVKLHPEVVAGRRRGYLAERARRQSIALIERDVNVFSLVEGARRVYTVTSQCGMEALLCGTRVTCFGMPFYAGWGATDDRVACPRRTRRRTPLEIFALAYGSYARYVDPIRGEACSLGRWLERLAVLKAANERNRGHTECVGFGRARRRELRRFLRTTDGSARFGRDPGQALAAAAAHGGRLCSPAGAASVELEERASAAGVPLIRVGEGLLGALAGGSGAWPAASLVLDRRGIHYDPSRLSELEELLEYERFDDELLDAARRLRRRLLESWRAAPGAGGEVQLSAEGDRRRRVLVPGEAEDDPAVALGGGAIRSNLALLQAVRAACPDACLIFLPHPEVERGGRRGRLAAAEALRHCDRILPAASRHAALAAADEVHALTSLIGFEGLLRGLPVTTYGAPFYAGWGLSEDRVRLPRRTRRLSLDQLVAGALILYPAYVDPVTGLACDAETVAWRLAPGRAPRRPELGGRWLGQLCRGLRALTLAVGPLGPRSAS